MLWIKSLHIVFITSWFATLFYLPRIFVNLAQLTATNTSEYERLIGMAQRLSRFGWILCVPALGFGLWLWLGYGIGSGQTWLYAKLALVLLALGYQHGCERLLQKFVRLQNQRSPLWYRWFNEIPVFLLLGIVLLVVIKPQF